ncbi:MAG: transcriptional regulator [Candidatus Delongbacteria bacterium]|jgi:DNA-binding transcriptional ArsR family regulator|nr:transcriptional regulator [Candidatus Delongbacteria bacterium]
MEQKEKAEFDYKQLDDIIHSRIRLAIMSVLLSVDEADFNFLKENVKATDGNLSVHLKKIETAGYLSVEKLFFERKPLTKYKLTEEGKEAFEKYVERLEKMLGR